MPISIKNVLTTIKNAAEDLTTLDVVTLSGEIQISSAVGPNGTLNLKELYKTIETNAKTNANLDVVAFTHIDFDCDAVNFVKTGASEGEAPLLAAHNQMVKTSQETRAGVVKMIKDSIGI